MTPTPRARAATPHRASRIAGLLASLLAAVLIAVAAPALAQPRVALVIGNADYTHVGALRNPVNDATDVARSLRGLGFEVTLRTNLSQRDFNRALTAFGERIRPGTVALFYFAGHGIQFRGQNFLIPVDARIPQEQAVRTEGVDVDLVLDQFQNASVGLVILDACRNNPFERAIRSGGGGGLAKVEAPKGMLIAFSTAPGRVAEDGTNTRNSPYTGALVRALGQPERPVETVFKEVRREVSEATGNRQLPWETSSLTGEFYFRTPAAVAAASPAATTAAAPAPGGPAPAARDADLAVELAFWDAIKNSTQATDYEAYLAQYPEGRFAVLARARLRSLGGTASPPAAAAAASVAAAASPAVPAPAPAPAAVPVPAPSAAPAPLPAPAPDAARPVRAEARPPAEGAAPGPPPAPAGAPVRRVVYRVDDVHWRERRDVVLEVTARSGDRTEFGGGRRVEAPAGRTSGAVDPALRLGLLDTFQPPAGWVPDDLAPERRIASVRYPVEGRCELQLAGRVLAPTSVALPAAREGDAPRRVEGVPIEYTGAMSCALPGVSAGGTFFPVRIVVTHARELGRIVRAEFDGTSAPAAQLRFREVLTLLSAD